MKNFKTKKNSVLRLISAGMSALMLCGALAGCAAPAPREASAEPVTPAHTEQHTTASASPRIITEEKKYSAPDGAGGSGSVEEADEYDSYSTDSTDALYEMAPLYNINYDVSYDAAYRDTFGGTYQNSEEYTHETENTFKRVADAPLSTFSADVDTASYTNVRRMLNDDGYVFDTDAVRIEELINYFHYDYALPKDGEAFGITTQYTVCPWNPDNRLLLIGARTPEIRFDDRPDNNLVFLIDVSGSMYSDDKLPLVQKAFALLAENLTERDRVSIVTYAGYETVVLEGEPGNNTARIVNAINDLEAGGSTAGAAGIKRAYSIAEEYFIEGGNNRILLATDGDLNVGVSSVEGLNDLVSKKRKSGVFLSVLGVGSGNLKDNKMETLADNGNGNYSYLDSIYEAKKVLVDELGGTLITVAKDVKFQVEFNPENVDSYRLVGYENRLLRDQDFADDTVDAGEIGAGHTVTVLYEIVPAGSGFNPDLKYQPKENDPALSATPKADSPYAGELLTVSTRYKEPDGDTSKLLSYTVNTSDYTEILPAEASWACAVAEYGMLLKGSADKGSSSRESVLQLAEDAMRKYHDDYRREFYELADKYLE